MDKNSQGRKIIPFILSYKYKKKNLNVTLK